MKEKWQVDNHGFNVVTFERNATVALLQPHAKMKERAKLIAAAPTMAEALRIVASRLDSAGWCGSGKNQSGDATFTIKDADQIYAAMAAAGIR